MIRFKYLSSFYHRLRNGTIILVKDENCIYVIWDDERTNEGHQYAMDTLVMDTHIVPIVTESTPEDIVFMDNFVSDYNRRSPNHLMPSSPNASWTYTPTNWGTSWGSTQ